MPYALSILATALTMLIGMSGSAFAGAVAASRTGTGDPDAARHRLWWGGRRQVFQTQVAGGLQSNSRVIKGGS